MPAAALGRNKQEGKLELHECWLRFLSRPSIFCHPPVLCRARKCSHPEEL
jgi:hypothetical protein